MAWLLGQPLAVAADSTTLITSTLSGVRYVVVDHQTHDILSIYSNTSDPVTPSVLQDSITGPIMPLTPDIQANYNNILKTQPWASKTGKVYTRPPAAELQKEAHNVQIRILLQRLSQQSLAHGQ